MSDEAPGRGRTSSAATTGDRPPASSWPVLVTGGAFALFLLTTEGWLLDHGHYLNKSLHYAEDPWSYGIRDYMYGVPGVDHIPRGTILNAYETLAGFLSAVSGISHITLTYHVLAVLAGFLLPVGLAWTARELGAQRPDLVGVVGVGAMLLLADTHDAKVLVNRLAEGKLVAGMVALPIFIGAVMRWWRRNDTASLVLACAAAVATFGLSSTAGIALLPAAAATTVVGVLTTPAAMLDRGRLLRGALPGLLVVVMSGVGFVVHRTIGTGLDRFPSSHESWLTRIVGRSADVTVDGSETAVFLLILCVVIVVLLGRTQVQRCLIGALFGGLVLVVYNPVLFSTVWDAAGVAGLSWRAAWALPLGLTFGLAVDALHGRSATAGAGVLGAVLVVALFAASASPLAQTDQSLPSVYDDIELDAALALLRATPDGGRFLGPERIEVAAMAHSTNRYASTARQYFVADLAGYDDLPADFASPERLTLASLVEGGYLGPRFAAVAAATTTTDPRVLLDLLAIDAVCVTQRTDPGLRRVLRDTWTRVAATPRCRVYARDG